MLVAQFLIPVVSGRSGRRHAPQLFAALEAQLFELFNGWTYHGIVLGCWCEPKSGKAEYDGSRFYEVALVGPKELSSLKSLLIRSKWVFEQTGIYLVTFGDAKIL